VARPLGIELERAAAGIHEGDQRGRGARVPHPRL
jgi:hypothetical protein